MRKLIVFAIMTTLLPFSSKALSLRHSSSISGTSNETLYYATDQSDEIDSDIEFSNGTSVALEQQTTTTTEEGEFAKRYFTHLVDNKITNNLGNCGYTAIGMYLSYLDTFWNGAIIPKKYKSDYSTVTSTIFQNSYNPVDYQSPGICDTFQYSPKLEDLENQVNISDHQSIAYKSAMDLLVMPYVKEEIDNETFLGHLFKLGLDAGVITPHYTLDSYTAYSEDKSVPKNMKVLNPAKYQPDLGVSPEIITSILNQYISDIPMLKEKVSIHHEYLNLLTTGDPERAKMRLKVISLLKQGHPVLLSAKGYDSNDERFGHDAIAYDYVLSKNDLNKGNIYGNLGYNKDKVHTNFDKFFDDGISGYWYFDFDASLPRTYTHRYFFSDWNQFYSPYENAQVSHPITPSDYGFADAYPTDEDTMNIGMQHCIPNESFYFTTKRYRTGYIQQHSVVMSCIKTGITNAYIEYEFTNPIYGIIVNMSYWREFEHDLLDGTTGRAGLKIYGYQDPNSQYDEGGWINCYDFLNSTNPLSRDRPSEYVIDFDQLIRRIQFYASVNTPMESDRNKGRICIGNLYVITSRNHTFY